MILINNLISVFDCSSMLIIKVSQWNFSNKNCSGCDFLFETKIARFFDKFLKSGMILKYFKFEF
jgi:hypothetical protein